MEKGERDKTAGMILAPLSPSSPLILSSHTDCVMGEASKCVIKFRIQKLLIRNHRKTILKGFQCVSLGKFG